jgi:hypothetical protein
MIQEQVVTFVQVRRDCPAYRNGWEDGRFGHHGTFAENASLSPYADHDRLAYYRGHREGRRIRDMLAADARSA